MNDMTLFLDLILIASGAYCMYTFLRLAVTKRLFKNGLLVPKEKKISDCADEAAEAENAMHLLGARLEKIEHYAIPGTDITHAAVVIEKIKPTHPKYPRKWAQIKKNPL